MPEIIGSMKKDSFYVSSPFYLGSGIRDEKCLDLDPGSGMKIYPDPVSRIKHSGSATLLGYTKIRTHYGMFFIFKRDSLV
jgi:hypothetical protein